tara:strand:- start:10 stop:282 length:273 start_codon:yes stop_codon:yes gene_type:complete
MKTIKQLADMKLRTTDAQKKKVSNIIIWAQHLGVSIEITARGYRFIDSIEVDSDGKTTWKKFADFVKLPLAERSFLVKCCNLFDVDVYQK